MGLLDLPAEVTELIARSCDPHDLLALRLVNHDISSKIIRTFTANFFKQRMLLLCDEKQLRTLINIANHPHFGRAVQVLVCCIDELPQPDDFLRTDRLEESPPPAPEDLSLDQFLELKDKEREYHTLLEEQNSFQETQTDLHLLTVIFSRLRRQGGIPQLGVVDRYSAYWNGPYDSHPNIPTPRLEALTGELLAPPVDYSRAVEIVVEAASLSLLKIDAFTICYDNWYWSMTYLVSDKMIDHSKQMFFSLKHLQLMFAPDEDADTVTVHKMLELFAVAQSLETLSLQAHEPERNSPDVSLLWALTSMIMTQGFPMLRQLWLSGFVLEFAKVTSFIECHDKLKHLHLRHCHFPSVHANRSFWLHHEHPDCVEKHNKAVHELIRDRTGFSMTRLEGCTVREWEPDEEKWT